LLPLDIEHYRPKGEIIDAQGKRLVPGYWWLASSWSNLLPSCIDCNRSRHHRIAGARTPKYGKENRFPLPTGQSHAQVPGREVAEQPLLIDPSREDPSPYLNFELINGGPAKHDCIVRPRLTATVPMKARSDASINVYGLNRPGLTSVRGKRVAELAWNLFRIERDWLNAKSSPPSTLAKQTLENCRLDLREVIRNYLYWKAPYAAACRTYFLNWKEDFHRKASTASMSPST
jgi:hypothetical protein